MQIMQFYVERIVSYYIKHTLLLLINGVNAMIDFGEPVEYHELSKAEMEDYLEWFAANCMLPPEKTTIMSMQDYERYVSGDMDEVELRIRGLRRYES